MTPRASCSWDIFHETCPRETTCRQACREKRTCKYLTSAGTTPARVLSRRPGRDAVCATTVHRQAGRSALSPRGKACYASAPRACSAVRHQLKGRRELAGSVSARRSSRRTFAAANPGPAAWCRSAAGPPACAGPDAQDPPRSLCSFTGSCCSKGVSRPIARRDAPSVLARASGGDGPTPHLLGGRRRCWKRYEWGWVTANIFFSFFLCFSMNLEERGKGKGREGEGAVQSKETATRQKGWCHVLAPQRL